MSPKVIALCFAGSGGVAGSGFGINYYVSGWGSDKDSKVQEESIASSPAVTSDQQELKETEKATPLEQKSNTDLKVDSLPSESSENSCAWYDWSCYSDEEEVLNENTSGTIYLIKELDETWQQNFYKLKIVYGEDKVDLANQELSLTFESSKTKGEIDRLIDSFNGEITVNPEDISEVLGTLKSNQNKLVAFFGDDCFRQLEEEVRGLLPFR